MTTTTEPDLVTTQPSFASETTTEPVSETTFNFRESNASANISNSSGNFPTDIGVPFGIGALVILSVVITIFCGFMLRKKYKRIQKEKTKACQETEKSEDKPPLGKSFGLTLIFQQLDL